jgi:photosystem II stability/assembly factor-like uncharacterized protein
MVVSMKRAVLFAMSLFTLICPSLQAQTGWFLQTAPHDDINLFSVWFTDRLNGYIAGDLGTIYATTDGGTNWTEQTSGTSELLNCIRFIDRNTGFAAGQNGILLKTTNAGSTWNKISTGVSAAIFDVHTKDGQRILLACSGGALRATSDGGTTWLARGTSFSSNNVMSIAFADDSTGWIVGYQGNIDKTTNGGRTWRPQDSKTNELLYSVSFADTLVGTAVGRDGMILRTKDGGKTWTQQTTASPITTSIQEIQYVDNRVGYMAIWYGLLLKTTDAGDNWWLQDNPCTTSLEGIHFTDTLTGCAVGWNGTILRTTDGGPVGVNAMADPVPATASITSMWPCPMKTDAVAHVDVSISRPGPVTLTVLDALGRNVRLVHRGYCNAGEQTISWDVKGLAPGLYFQRLVSGTAQSVKRFIVVR